MARVQDRPLPSYKRTALQSPYFERLLSAHRPIRATGDTFEELVAHGKLRPPPLPADLVSRPRLLEALDAAVERPATLISAPAGYGKTTLVGHWLETSDRPGAWVSLDAEDDAVAPFVIHVVAAIRTVLPDTMARCVGFIMQARLPEPRALSLALLNDLAEIEDRFVLVLDGMEGIRDPAVLNLLSSILRRPPASMHLVLVGRRDPFLPIASLRSAIRIAEIRAGALRFRPEETLSLLDKGGHGTGGLEPARAWTDATEGWVTGLKLALDEASAPDESDREVRALTRHVREYLLYEVLARQPAPIRQFLLDASILDRLSAPLCDALSGDDDGAAAPSEGVRLSWLWKEGLFLVPLDGTDEWFRLHRLVREFLSVQRRRESDPEREKRQHRRVSRWFAEHGHVDDAVRHAIAADDPVLGATVVEGALEPLLDSGRWDALADALDALPEELVDERPDLLVGRAWVHLRRAEYGEAASALDRAERLLGSPATDGQPADGRLRSLRSCLRRAAGDDEGAVAHARAALAALDASDTFHRGAATGTLYAGLRGLGRRDEAERVAAGALEEDADVGARSRGRLLGLMCELHWLAGDSGALEAAVSRCEDLARGERLPAPMAVAQLYRGLLGFDRNELPRAEEHLHASLESIDLLSPLQALQLRFGLACVYQAQGRHSAAQRMAEDANLALPEAHGEASPGRHLHSQRMLEADLALKCGDPDRALERIGGRADSHAAAVPSRLDPQLLQARALLIREDEDGWDLAGKLIERLQDADDTVPGDTLAIEHGLLEALWRVRIGDEETALERIGACLGLAERSGVVRCFFDLGTALPDLLKPHSRRGPHTAFVRRVLSAYYEDRLASGGANNASDDGASAPRINPVDALTPTENETLLLLNKGLYNREIAERRFVSVETVKTHLKNIYRKLNVSDRRQAVTRARALGLVARD